MTARSTPTTPSCPDLGYIRAQIPVAAIAVRLGLNVISGTSARCWRVENHKHGDRTPSLNFHKRTNKAMCFVCDQHEMSNVDLVMLYLGRDLRAAITWITERFPVLPLRPGTHLKKRQAWFPRYHSGVNENIITLLVRSGVWGELTHAERSILPALQTFVNRETQLIEISYQGIKRYSGVSSSATIAAAIKHFERMHLLRVARQRGELIFRGINQYVLTPEDPTFQLFMAKIFQRQREEVELEKQFRAEEKQARAQRCNPIPSK
jgi:hypothetical protein